MDSIEAQCCSTSCIKRVIYFETPLYSLCPPGENEKMTRHDPKYSKELPQFFVSASAIESPTFTHTHTRVCLICCKYTIPKRVSTST